MNPLSSGSSGRTQRALRGVSHAGGWLVRAGRPGGELLVHLTGKLTRGPAGQVSGLIRWLAPAAEMYGRAQKCRTRILAGAFRR